MSDYKYVNRRLIPTIAAELIVELFADKGEIEKSGIAETVLEVHLDRGGAPPMRQIKRKYSSALHDVVYEGLSMLKRNGQSTYRRVDLWTIQTQSVLGDGSESVYLFYYPSIRQISIDRGEPHWKCKIGRTEGDPYQRVVKQVKSATAVPESPQIGLVIKPEDCVSLERALHSILDIQGKKAKDAMGEEWYITSPKEVTDIYRSIIDFD